MAISTVLDYVQRALSIVDGNEIESITDGVEAEQVFLLLKNVYDEILDSFNWPHLNEFQQLSATGVAHVMSLPDDCVGFNWVRYNKKPVTFIEPYAMQEILDSRDTTLSTVDDNGVLNDRDPRYWTTINDDDIVFDSYDTSLQSSLSLIESIRKPTDLAADTDHPDIPERMEYTLRNMLFAEVLRILKGDESRAATYDKKADEGIAGLKRWAKRHNRTTTWFGQTYGRRGGSGRSGSDINIIQG